MRGQYHKNSSQKKSVHEKDKMFLLIYNRFKEKEKKSEEQYKKRATKIYVPLYMSTRKKNIYISSIIYCYEGTGTITCR